MEENAMLEESSQGKESPEKAEEMTSFPETEPTIIAAQKVQASPPAERSCCGADASVGMQGVPSFIYALGSIKARFPSLGVEKEFARVVKERKTADLTDQQVLYQIMSQEENRYLAREVCWIFTVEHIDTYILKPRSNCELMDFVEAINPEKRFDRDVIIGVRGPMAPPNMCNGLQAPIVVCDNIYSFEIDEFINDIPKPENMRTNPFKQAARELFFRIMQLADNVGEMDEHRAVNYIALRYPAIYALAVEMFSADKALTRVEVRSSRLTGARKIVQVVFSFVDRNTDVLEKYFARIDVTEKRPFLFTKLQPFYDR